MKRKHYLIALLSITIIIVATLVITSFRSGKVNLEQVKAPQKGEEIAVIKTNYGVMKMRLFPKIAPKAVENFTTQAKKGYYDGKTFYRIKKDYFIHAASPETDKPESIWGKYFEDEFDEKYIHINGAVSLANMGEADTNASEFFIVHNKKVEDDIMQTMEDLEADGDYAKDIVNAYKKLGGVPDYDMKYTVFGQVYEGLEVVDKIADVEVDEQNFPKKDVIIQSIKIEKYK
ncbi:peptidylprolyl isomerase [Anaeromicropila herbilytica]|uniref:Peptidyl-prolyl cis-trans isomerase n=1 Tax=Anaeromicropila herbilytica TaxID=2785025 RepID=A0A7R7EHJ0_9FIRM|nr:peptidylprolyl isomerase [Anaeromicropila herbilytica]BCN28835.1 peptidyl-prolyl cis-trans isomerase [Anaeromicropila herbilytica]